MKFTKQDLKRIGHTTYSGDGKLTDFICSVETANIEFLLLREILATVGCEIILEADHEYGAEFKTNLDWEVYQSL